LNQLPMTTRLTWGLSSKAMPRISPHLQCQIF
jgi:hypothetical protein